jgi:predicted ATPase/class 3 adenylate cyclase/DNA-binding CsgD family transcriptional regulator
MENAMGTDAAVKLPTGVVTVVLADVEGSVRSWEADPPAMAQAMARLDEIVDTALAAHGGVRPVEQGEGDSFVAAFVEPVDAVAAALAIQRGLRAHQSSSDEGVPSLRLRMAIHTDEAHLRGTGNYSGALVNRAARLRALAHGDQVLLSGNTCGQLGSTLPDCASLIDLGVHNVRDVPEPIRVWQLRHDDLDREFPPLRSPDALATNLPVHLTTFVGRVDELLSVRKLLYENRLVTLSGPGGVGKTRLAVELAAEAFDAYPGGAWFVDLSPVADPAAVGGDIAASLHLRGIESRTPLELVASHFADDRVLLVVDNCEHVVGAVAALLDALLRACPRLDVVVTSREPLNVAGEAVYSVPPLGLPQGDQVDAALLADCDAVGLFVDRAHLANPDFELDDETAPTIAAVCARIDCLPLAIELAAARVRVMTLDQIAETMESRFDVLGGGARTAPVRQQSVERCVAWSYDLLDERQQTLLRRLSIFAGSFTMAAAATVGGDEDRLRGAQAFDLLLSLVDRSLVVAAGGRYHLLATIRSFAADRLDESGDDALALHARHLSWLVDTAADAEAGLADKNEPRVLEALRVEVPNIDAVLTWASTNNPPEALRLAASLVRFALVGGNLLRGWRWLEPLLDSDSIVEPDVRAKARFGAGLLVLLCGDMALAMSAPTHLSKAKQVFEELGDAAGAARVDGLQAVMTAAVAGPSTARPQFDAAVGFLRRAGDEWWAGLLSSAWAATEVQRGRAADVVSLLEHEVAAARGASSTFRLRLAGSWLAAAYGMLGDHDRAIELAEASLAEQRAVHDPDLTSFMLFVIGDAHYHRGDLDLAEHYGLEAAETAGRHFIVGHAALGHNLVARVAMARGDAERARLHFQRAVDIAVDAGAMHAVARHAPGLVTALRALNRSDDAAAVLGSAIEGARSLGPSSDLGRLLLTAAAHAEEDGNDDRAEDLIHEALATIVHVRSRPLAVTAFEHLAAIAARQEGDAEAARLFAAAATIRAELGRRGGDASVLDDARARLSEETFAQAWEDGAAMSVEDAVAYAARGRGARKRPSSGWRSLTPTEHRVVELVTEGLTNPQIGERLFISKGTVRTHLSHIFAKLDVTTRSQLAAEATRRIANPSPETGQHTSGAAQQG